MRAEKRTCGSQVFSERISVGAHKSETSPTTIAVLTLSWTGPSTYDAFDVTCLAN
jgi:hypothetical protein